MLLSFKTLLNDSMEGDYSYIGGCVCYTSHVQEYPFCTHLFAKDVVVEALKR